ncbi:MAG: GntR family transcriptional regulator, partial [Lentisphaerae bacterium]|nr:GntR family transcriptional regulator [Lentisphaerota bacterium]
MHVKKQTRTPKWQTVLTAVLEQIDRGEYAPGDRFLTLRELGARYCVSEVTAQRVFRELVARRVIATSRRAGATVTGAAQTATIYLCLCNELFANPGRLDQFREIDSFMTGVRQGADGRFA